MFLDFTKFISLLDSGDFIDESKFVKVVSSKMYLLKDPFYSSSSGSEILNSEHIKVCQNYIEDYYGRTHFQLRLNGSKTKNIWICKPAAKSRGRGIFLTSSYDEIRSLLEDHKEKWVIQKYIEEPFLLLNRKFDFRQWILVTDIFPLTIWFYEENYLRFCSVEYNDYDISNT